MLLFVNFSILLFSNQTKMLIIIIIFLIEGIENGPDVMRTPFAGGDLVDADAAVIEAGEALAVGREGQRPDGVASTEAGDGVRRRSGGRGQADQTEQARREHHSPPVRGRGRSDSARILQPGHSDYFICDV